MLAPIVASFALAACLQDAPPADAGASVHYHSSPQGVYKLAISDIEGDRTVAWLTRHDPKRTMDLEYKPETLWSRSFDHSWDEVTVTDVGFVAGIAYTGGGRDAWRDSELIVTIVGTGGELLCDERSKRRRSRFLNEPADPKVAGMFVHEDLQRLVVRIAAEDPTKGHETWWTYALATGEVLAKLDPREGLDEHVRLRNVVDVQPIRWTPLTLVQWWVGGPQPGVRFAALDEAWQPVWDLAVPRAYGVLPEEASTAPFSGRPDSFVVDTPREFTLRLSVEGRDSVFTVEELQGHRADREDGANEQAAAEPRWWVNEVRRRPRRSAPPTTLPELELAKLAEVPLGSMGPGNELFSIVGFTFRGPLIEMIGRDSSSSYTMLLADQSGEVRSSRTFTETDFSRLHDIEWHALDEPRELLASGVVWHTRKDKRSVSFVRVNGLTGRVRSEGTLRIPGVAGVAPLDNGGFVVLSSKRPDRGEPYLFAVGPNSWQVLRGSKERMPWLVSLTRSSSGDLIALDAHRDILRTFSQGGRALGEVHLREVWRERPHRPYCVSAGPHGTLVIADSDESRTLRVVGASGRTRRKVVPTGRALSWKAPARLSPSGDVWLLSGGRVVRLSDRGVAQRPLASPTLAPRLSHVGAVYIDFRGRICTQDLATGTVHVFDHTGESLQALRPWHGQSSFHRESKLAVRSDGSIYISCFGREADHIGFGPDGDWLGFTELGSHSVVFDPRADRRWVQNGTLKLVDDQGKKLHEIPRLPGGRLLDGVPAVAPNGKLAVVNDTQVALYDRDGELQDAFAVALTVAPRVLAYSTGGWLVVSEKDVANVIRVKDRSVWSFAVDEAPSQRGVAYGFSPDGDELWAVERDRSRLHRFALSEPK